MSPALFMMIVLFVALLVHLPIGFSLGLASISTVLLFDMFPGSFIIQTYYNSANSFTLLAIPFFILAGDLMLVGGISEKLVNFGKALFGHKDGSLAVITVFCCAIFAALSGSGPATTAAIGGIMIPYMVDDGYDRGFASSLACTAGALGPIIPPSIILAMYGVTIGVSISDLFAGAMIPGILMAVMLAVYATIASKKHGFGTKHPKATGKERIRATIDAFWALLAPVIILGGIYGGICTPTEAAVVACVYAMIVGIFVYKKLKFKDLFKVVAGSTFTAGTCLILLGGANLFGRVLAAERVPTMIASFALSMISNKYVLLLIINILLLIAGMFMETLTAILVLGPLLVAVCEPFGISALHLGVIMCVNLAIGLTTPPVGVNLYVAARTGKVSLDKMVKWLIPEIGILLIVQFAFTYIEPLVTFLPSLMK